MYDPTDERGVPTSRGVPRVVQIAAIIGILCIFGMGAYTIYTSGYGHVFPSMQALRIPLNGSYKP
ncbi:MAG TPA: hypothetical protein VKT72_13895 [Candidatus Baltobacteraceae bacterium]|nr:hypothetical protein [Candidatus Baltobacteraceae bacterium]